MDSDHICEPIRGLCHCCNSSNVELTIDKDSVAKCKDCIGKSVSYLKINKAKERKRDMKTYGYAGVGKD